MVVLALMPMAPAAAVQTISWTTSPPATAVVGQQVSFAWAGTANTFLGARITGCFANFPDGNNYTNTFGGNFTTGNCQYTNRTLTNPGTYPITVGFTLSTGSTMTQSWNISVAAPTPTVAVPGHVTAEATSVEGAAVSFNATASDNYYGAYAASCTPASGSMFPVGTTSVTCSATNAGGKTGYASFPVTVSKTSPTLLWSPPATFTYGATYGDLMTAEMQASDATGTITYNRADDTELTANDLLSVGADQVIKATYVPSGPAADAYRQVTAERTFSVDRASSSVTFGSETPTSKQYGDAPFPVEVLGTAGAGDVAVTAQSGSACTVSSPSAGTSATATITITGAGTCVLLADQAATDHYTAAPTAQWSVTAANANPQITWTPPSALTYGDAVSDLFNATANVPGTMTYLIDGIELAPATVLDAGMARSVSAVFTPQQSADYTDATASRTFTVEPAEQTLTLGQIPDQTFGAAPFNLAVGGTGPGAVTATTTGSCTVDGLTVTITTAGTCTVTVAKAATNNYVAATPVVRTFTIKPAAVVPAPRIAKISSTSGPTRGMSPVTITGTGFTGATSVKFGTVAARFTVKNSTTILATAPALNPGTYDIRVTSARGTSAPVAADRYTVRPVPKITKLSAASGLRAGKKSVTVRGTGFVGTTSVKFGNVAAKFKVKNSTTIVVTSPRLKKGKYDIRVTTSGGTSAKTKADRYTVKK